MSLVDYASSDDDVPEIEEENQEIDKEEAPKPEPLPPPPPVVAQKRKPASSSRQQQESVSHSMENSVEKLPDASLLFSTTSAPSLSISSDHASRVAAALAESASRKRDSDAPSASAPRGKLPRGTLPHMKNVPETIGGMLVPPQLSGRSNIVTEDISKLFVKARADPSSQ